MNIKETLLFDSLVIDGGIAGLLVAPDLGDQATRWPLWTGTPQSAGK